MALAMGTMSLIVAMPMESELVAEFFSTSLTFRGDVIDFNLIFLTEHQFTPSTLALLLVKQYRECPPCCRVVFQSLAPVQEITVVRACCTFYFHMASDRGRVMPFQDIIFRGGRCTVLAFAAFPVSSPDPMSVFVGMPAYRPRP